MVIAAECAGVHVALTMRFGEPSCSVVVSLKRPGRCARAVVDIAVGGEASVLRTETFPAGSARASASAAVIRIAVIKGGAVREIPLVIVDRVVVVPVVPPVPPAPAEPAEEADAETDAEEEVRSAVPDAG